MPVVSFTAKSTRYTKDFLTTASSRFELLASCGWFVRFLRLEGHIHAQRTIESKTMAARSLAGFASKIFATNVCGLRS